MPFENFQLTHSTNRSTNLQTNNLTSTTSPSTEHFWHPQTTLLYIIFSSNIPHRLSDYNQTLSIPNVDPVYVSRDSSLSACPSIDAPILSIFLDIEQRNNNAPASTEKSTSLNIHGMTTRSRARIYIHQSLPHTERPFLNQISFILVTLESSYGWGVSGLTEEQNTSLVELPANQKAIGCIWMFRSIENPYGNSKLQG